MPDYTRLLNASTSSHDGELFCQLYAELKKIAAGRMALERHDHALDATALVHEAWLRLQKSGPEKWRDRKQFFAAAVEAMRQGLALPGHREKNLKFPVRFSGKFTRVSLS